MFSKDEEAHYHHILADIDEIVEGFGIDQVMYDLEKHFPQAYKEIETFINQAKPKKGVCALLKA